VAQEWGEFYWFVWGQSWSWLVLSVAGRERKLARQAGSFFYFPGTGWLGLRSPQDPLGIPSWCHWSLMGLALLGPTEVSVSEWPYIFYCASEGRQQEDEKERNGSILELGRKALSPNLLLHRLSMVPGTKLKCLLDPAPLSLSRQWRVCLDLQARHWSWAMVSIICSSTLFISSSTHRMWALGQQYIYFAFLINAFLVPRRRLGL
jgi:hypothetical protein